MKILVVVFVVLLSVSVAFAGEYEQLQAQYQSVLQQLQENMNTQQMLLNGFKLSNSTYMGLVKAQQKLQKRGKAIAEKLNKLENPPKPEAPAAPEVPPDATDEVGE
jgi:hypothetical protein